MQLLKILAVVSQKEKQVLVVDGDTIYLKSRTWVSNEEVVFPISQEFLPRHTNFNRRRFGLKSDSGLGFVTHHQVVCKECAEELICRIGGIASMAEKMQSVFAQINQWDTEYPSEWQFLGDFSLETQMHRVVPARFANVGINRKMLMINFDQPLNSTNILSEIEKLANSAPNLHSISLHSYK